MSKQLVDEPILVDESNLGNVILNYRQIQKSVFIVQTVVNSIMVWLEKVARTYYAIRVILKGFP